MSDYPPNNELYKGAAEVLRRHVEAANTGNREEFENTTILSLDVFPRREQKSLDKYWETVRTACPIELNLILPLKISAERNPVSGFRFRTISLRIAATTSFGVLHETASAWYTHPRMFFFVAGRSLWNNPAPKPDHWPTQNSCSDSIPDIKR